MKVWLLPGTPRDQSHYLCAILHAYGVWLVERVDSATVLAHADPRRDLIVVTPGAADEDVDGFLAEGGQVIAICPGEKLASKAGLTRLNTREARTRMRLTTGLCRPARGRSLWNPSASVVYKGEPGAHVWAWQYVEGDPTSECPAICCSREGSGRLVVLGYDPALAIARLRQGSPRLANHIPAGDRFPRSVHLHEPDPPLDTYWQPTADLHALVFCNVVKRLLSEKAPVPVMWHLPGSHPAALIFSGDEDGAAQSENQREFSDVKAAGGTMTLYVIPEKTTITRELIERYERDGHTISVHPNLYPTKGRSQAEQLARAESEVRLMREKFGVSVHTVRNHSTIWPGYVDLPELWERLGIGMDANCFASRYAQSCEWGPFVNVDAALPLPFVREDGTLIRVYQQPTHLSDDMLSLLTKGAGQKLTAEGSEYLAQCLIEDAASIFHAPICVCIHPSNYVKFATELGQALLTSARQQALPICSVDRWYGFWQARAASTLQDFLWEDKRLQFTLRGPGCPELTANIPVSHAGMRLRTLTVNGRKQDPSPAARFGESIVAAECGTEANKVVATYE
jgi:hypothetical protein